MSITRRQFIRRTGLISAGTLLGPGLFASPFVRRALADIGSKYFIVLFLDGGNDGLNTVTPISNGGGTLRSDYEQFRDLGGDAGLQLRPTEDLYPNQIANDPITNAELGLHPGLAGFAGKEGYGGLKALYDAGTVAVIQGCGYPDYSLSHDDARTIWRTANPFSLTGYSGTGWVGRHLADPSLPYVGADIPAVNIQDEIAGEFRQYDTSVLAVRRLAELDFPYDGDPDPDEAAKDTAFNALYGIASGGSLPIKLIGDTGAATYRASKSYPQAHAHYRADRQTWSDKYSKDGSSTAINKSLARDLREVAKVIYAVESGLPDVNARYFQVSNGGYDTHSDQKAGQSDGQHFSLHAEVGASLKLFFDDLADMNAGLPERVAVLVWSEFARRVQQNQNGTDHGSQGPMFVIGGKVNGGVYGNHPNINEAAWTPDGYGGSDGNTRYWQLAGDPLYYRSTDLRDVYGTVLTKWLGMTDLQTQGLLPLDGGPAAERWTVPNFDLRRGAGLPADPPLFIP